MPRILILGDINSAHIIKWATAITERGFAIGIFTLSAPQSDWWKEIGISVFQAGRFGSNSFSGSLVNKIAYLKGSRGLKKAIASFKPDILHAHYASSYGLLGALSGFKPFIISVWGSDIYLFPNQNFLTKFVLKYNLSKAQYVTATGRHLADATKPFTKTRIEVIPFGIDTGKFFPSVSERNKDQVVVGTVKALETIYGTDILIQAFAKCRKRLPEQNLKLVLVGEGSQKSGLISLAQQLGVMSDIEFKGSVPYSVVQGCYQAFDIFANVSRFESFGVSVLEASACGIPSVISDAGGLTEVGIQDKTCLYVKPEDVEGVAQALITLISDESKRTAMGKNAQIFVKDNFTIESCTSKMVGIYNSVLAI